MPSLELSLLLSLLLPRIRLLSWLAKRVKGLDKNILLPVSPWVESVGVGAFQYLCDRQIVCVQQICYQSGTPNAQFGEAKIRNL